MQDVHAVAASLSAEDRDALLLMDGGERTTVPDGLAERLRDRGLAVILPDGHMDLSETVWRVLDLLRGERLCPAP